MIIISSLFFMVAFSKNEQFSIYTIDYYLDKAGNRLPPNADHKNAYQYGDIIIETLHRRYKINKTYAAYDYAARIIHAIRTSHDDNLFINLDEMNENWSAHLGTLEIEEISK